MPTYPHDRDPVAQLDGLVDVMGDQDDRLAQLALQSEEKLVQLAANDRIHRRERLIHEHDQGVGRERASYADPLLLPPGELHRIAVPELPLQTDAVEQLQSPLLNLLLGPVEQSWNGTDVVEHSAVREQPTALNDVPHLTTQRGLALGAKRRAVPGDAA